MTTAPPLEPEVAFFREIERAFVERRGDPLFISNADWVFLAKLWKKGVPQRIVLRGMTDAFDAHAHSFARKQKIRSLKFCETEIAASADRYRRALQAEGPGRRGLSGALESLAERIAAIDVPPALADAIEASRRGLLALAGAAATDKGVDAGRVLQSIEDVLVTAASEALGPEPIAAFQEGSRQATAAYQSRMPTKVYETLIEESVRRKILQRFGLPRLLLADIE
ncbi:MAG: hypothetical protein ABI565_09220 [Vicinamibacteria bacterium]